MLAQKMMNRQAPYGPIGMVSQNMSGNKKGAGGGTPAPVGVIGLKFNTAAASSGVTFSNSDTTAINSTGGTITSAKANATTTIGVSVNYYWEFIITVAGSARLGVGPSGFVCNASNQVGNSANEIAYSTVGFIFGGGSNLGGVPTATTGDVIGFQLDITASSSTLTILKNGTVILSSYNSTPYVTGYASAWVPIWSTGATLLSATISNNIYSYAGYTPIGTSATTIAASASVPAVADGKYDVYTFNASGTFTVGSTGAVRALVIAGGGGSTSGAGGGGAGGYLENGVTVTPQTYAITVGAGNTGSGSASVFSFVSTVGGGGTNLSGGSGAGGTPTGTSGFYSGQAGTAGQGFSGGQGYADGITYAGGGGGGSGGNGANVPVTNQGGNGGVGLTSSITGSAIARGGGGAGSGNLSNGTGTSGGGSATVNGTANTGGGGGACDGGAAKSGGSGVVIIRVRARA